MVISYRFVLLILFLILSTYLLLSPLIFTRTGVLVTHMESGNKCDNIKVGSIITTIEQNLIKNINDLNEFLESVESEKYYSIVVDGGPGGCVALDNNNLGFVASSLPREGLKFGMSIQGGTKVILGTETPLTSAELDDLVNILKKRVDVLNLQESDVRASDNHVEITTLSAEAVGDLLMRGKLETKIEQIVKLDGGGTLIVGDESYEVGKLDEKIEVGGMVVGVEESFYLNEIKFGVLNITNESVTIDALFFDNSDAIDSLNVVKYVRYDPQFKMYQFVVFVQLSENASIRFANITNGLSINYIGPSPTLGGLLKYYLDGDSFSELNIPFENAGEILSDVSIMGFEKDMAGAIESRRKVELALAGSLPIKLEIVRTERVEPIINHSLIVGVFVVMVSLSFFSLYASTKKIKSSMFGLLLLYTMVFCVFGVVAIVQKIFKPGWVFGVPSLIGLFVLLAFGTFRFVLLSKGRLLLKTKKYRYVSILLLVFSFISLFTPYRGFGLVVMVGLLVDMLITKPLYAGYLKKIV